MSYLESQIARLKTEKYHGVEGPEFQTDARRLTAGEPFEYVLGFVDFCGAKIDLSKRPMIPRPETAYWVERAIVELKQKSGPLRLADTFSGSGNVGLALLKNLPSAHVDICELDPALKEQIEINLAINEIAPERATVITASALEGLTGTYDAVFAVPPYVPYESLSELDQEMIDFEPHLAFFAHDDGHEFHRLLITTAHQYLKQGGVLYMEADIDDNEFVRSLYGDYSWRSLEFWPDPYGATPNVVLRK